MSFPPSSVIRDMKVFLEMAAVESAVLKLRPELAGRVRAPEAGRPVLSIDLSDGLRVVIGLVRESGSSLLEWMVEDGRPGHHGTIWPRGTRSAVLAQAVVDRVDTVACGEDPAES